MEPIYTTHQGEEIYSSDLNQRKIDLYSQKPSDDYSSIFDLKEDIAAIKKTA